MASFGDETMLSSSSDKTSPSKRSNPSNSELDLNNSPLSPIIEAIGINNYALNTKHKVLMSITPPIPQTTDDEISFMDASPIRITTVSHITTFGTYYSEIKDNSDDVLSLSGKSPANSSVFHGLSPGLSSASPSIDSVSLSPFSSKSRTIDSIEYSNGNLNIIDEKQKCSDTITPNEWSLEIFQSHNTQNKTKIEWSFKILECDVSHLEIGVVSAQNGMQMGNEGIKGIEMCAKAFYGMDMSEDPNVYYASYNSDGSERCFKKLSNHRIIDPKHSEAAVIRMCVNLDKQQIKFYLNDKKIGNAMSLQINQVYYPSIAFSGHCKFELIDNKTVCFV